MFSTIARARITVYFPFLIGLTYCIILVLFLPGYLIWDINMIIGLMILPFIWRINRGQYSNRYLIPTLVVCALALIAPVNTVLFFAIFFSSLFLIENFIGKANTLLPFWIFFISPLFKYIGNMIGFPIRLQLSEIAGNILSSIDRATTISGNVITSGGIEFSVDKACEGLNMLGMSLLICLFIIGYFQRQRQRSLSFIQICILLAGTVLLNILSNLLRIVLLVQFKIMPDNFLHETIGMICLIGYIIIPLFFIIKLFFNKTTKRPIGLKSTITNAGGPLFFHLVFAVAIISITVNVKGMDKLTPPISHIELKGYKKNILESGILKFENRDALIYMKSGVFYAPEHDPMVCWKGSGYDFKSIKKERIGNTEVYTGILINGKDRIFASWWFDNGTVQTINQFGWRWKSATGGGNFYLINVNAMNKTDLTRITMEILNRNL